ncbi:MAG: transporter substrate-binding domain-containing protein [Propionivibrio sp.]
MPKRPWPVLVASLVAAIPVLAGEPSGAPPEGTADPSIVVDVDTDNPPFMSGQGGQAVGLYPAILRVALGRCRGNVRIEAKPWRRAFVEIDKAYAGIGGLYKNAERLAKYDFSDPIYVENIAVYYRQAQPIEFRSVADLHGKRVGVLRGWSYGEAFDAARRDGSIATEEVSSDRSNFLKLRDGRLDAVLAIEESGKTNLAAYAIAGIGQASVFLASYPAHLAFNKTAGKTELLACFNGVLLEMKRDGSFERIVREELVR